MDPTHVDQGGVDGSGGQVGAGPGETLVWYVAYGSNMVPERLSCYLAGGRPSGARRTYVGARDPGPPRSTQPVRVPHRLVFAGVSEVWGGGVAFVEPQRSAESDTPCLAHLVTVDQLADLVIQECGREPPGRQIVSLPGPGLSLRVESGRYDLLVGVDPLDGLPAVLLTSSAIPAANEPAPAYADLVHEGRERAHGIPRGAFGWSA